MSEQQNANIDEAILIQSCQKGQTDAIEMLVLRYQNRIYNTILKICQNPEDAAELTQDTFVKIIEKIGSFEQKSSFYTWAFRIAVNLTLNYCKRSAKLGATSLDAMIGSEQQGKAALKDLLTAPDSPDPAMVAQNKELCSMLNAAIMKLDDAQRVAIVLRDIEGMTYAQIADILQTELGTVKSRISRARANLRAILEAATK